MRKLNTILISLVLVLCSCNEKQKPYSNAQRGVLAISELSLEVEPAKATASELDSYTITITDSEGSISYSSTWSKFQKDGGKLTLLAGNYNLGISSIASSLPYAIKDTPVYGINDTFVISANQTTDLGTLVCRLLQCKVTVDYSEDFLSALTGDCKATVSVTAGYPLEFPVSYNEGLPSYDKSAGYYAVASDGSATMEVVFSGSVNGKNVKMTKMFTALKAASWRQVKFVNKINDEGNADFVISIDDIIEDAELTNDLLAAESILGPDPDAPKGDGGIKLESTCSYDITQPVVVPAVGSEFVLTMKATVPNKVNKFTVQISSDNTDFEDAVKLINDGNTTLDLVNPSEGAKSVFTTILPFPYGDNVRDHESIDFDLSDAQAPLSVFKGHHSFIMSVVDKKGCKKDISVMLVVD